MLFLHPGFLFALFAVLIPVLIHLFYFRRYKQIVFSDLRFLKEVQEVTRSRQKIRDWIILLMRVLAIASLVFAFAQPYIPHTPHQPVSQQQAVAIYLDNSYSMLHEGETGPLLEMAKNKARAIVDGHPRGTSFILFSNEGGNPVWLNKTEAMQKLDALQVVPAQKTFQQVNRLMQNAFQNKGAQAHHAYVLSDFQTRAFEAAIAEPDTTISWHAVPVQSNVRNNVGIDSTWLVYPVIKANQTAQLMALLHNYGKEAVKGLVVTLRINGLQKMMRTIDLEPLTTSNILFTYQTEAAGWQEGELLITDYPVTFDDHLFFAYHTSSKSRILVINGHEPNAYLRKLFSGDAEFEWNETNALSIDYAGLQAYQCVILNEPGALTTGLATGLEQYVSAGGQLMVLPDAKETERGVLNAMLRKMQACSYENPVSGKGVLDAHQLTDPFFREVFVRVPENPELPVVLKHYVMVKNASTRGRMLLRLQNGDPFIWYAPFGKGRVVQSAVPLDPEFSDFQQHGLFVPVMLKLGRGLARQIPLYYQTDQLQKIELPSSEQNQSIVTFQHNKDVFKHEIKATAGASTVSLGNEVKEAGIYKYLFDDHKSPDGALAFNQNRIESDMQFDDPETLAKNQHLNVQLKGEAQLKAEIQSGISGTPLWRWFLIACLCFLAAEMILLRYKK